MARTPILIKQKRWEEMFNKILKLKKKRSGYVLIVVLILMLVLIIITYLYSDSLLAEWAIARNNKAAAIAFSMAESGIQEAVYRVQYHEATRNSFKGTGEITFPNEVIFTQDPGLIDNSYYEVKITNTQKGAATIESSGYYTAGLKTARRQIRVSISQASVPPPVDYGAIYTGGVGGGQSNADFDISEAQVRIYQGPIWLNRNFWAWGSSNVAIEGTDITKNEAVKTVSGYTPKKKSDVWPVLNCNCLIDDDGDSETAQCSDNPGCVTTPITRVPPPTVSFNDYKNLARTHVPIQYYANQAAFYTAAPPGTTTFNDVVYVDGPLTIDSSRTIIVNGVLAIAGSITIDGSVTINRVADNPSGVITTGRFNLNSTGRFSGTGLIWSGDWVRIDGNPAPFNLTGAIVSDRTSIASRTTNIYYDPDVVNATLTAGPITPVIEISHWEEEY